MRYISDKRVLAYLQAFQKRPRKDFKSIFPAAPEEALDLLQRCLVFSSQERITLEDCMKHPFFEKVKNLPDVIDTLGNNFGATRKAGHILPR
jgi:serine/threonine protein kinase